MSFIPPIGDASTTKKGVIQLTGDLSGTAVSPTVPGLAQKVSTNEVGQAGGVAALDGSGDVIDAAGVKVQSAHAAIVHDPDAPTIAAMPAGTLYTTSS